MGSFSIWHWVVVAVIVLLVLSGRGKISQLMGDPAAQMRSRRACRTTTRWQPMSPSPIRKRSRARNRPTAQAARANGAQVRGLDVLIPRVDPASGR
jgi:Sec-independent protein translocase protein TatA